MRTELTPQQIDSYREQGFLMVSDFLDSLELAELSADVDEAVLVAMRDDKKAAEVVRET
jgi:hypothetical protein